jgi:hypothetical protein
MKGHVTRKGNKWYFVIDVGVNPQTGKRKQQWFSGFPLKKKLKKKWLKSYTN